MHREVSFVKNNIRFILMKNRRETLCDIPNEYIEEIVYDINNPAELKFKIPSHITYRGKKVNYMVYDQIQGKMQIIVNINGSQERFIIDDDIDIEETETISFKTGTAYSYEKTLDNKTLLIGEGATRQLFKAPGEKVHVSDGILNWLEQQTQWRVDTTYLDEDACKETSLTTETLSINIGSFDGYVTKGTKIWSKKVSINIGEKPLTFEVVYPSVVTSDGITTNYTHDVFKDLPYPVDTVECRFSQDSDYRFGLTYYVNYTNGIQQTFKSNFINCADKTLHLKDIKLVYQTGNLVEQKNTKYRYFEQCSTTWYSFLMNDVAEAFDCVFLFDTYAKRIEVYSKNNFRTDPKNIRTHGLRLNYHTGVKQLNKTYKIGEVITRLYIESPNVSISEENPLGGEYVECFDYYINKGIMSTSLTNALVRYNALLDSKYVEWLRLKTNKNAADQLLSKYDSELLALQEQLKGENAILTGYIKGNDTAGQQKQSTIITQLEVKIEKLMGTIQTKKDEIATITDSILANAQSIIKENATDRQGTIFSQEDLEELDDYIIEGSMSNDYYTTSYGLYTWAKDQIESLNTIQIEFSIQTVDFLKKLQHPNGWQNVLTIGERILLDDKDIADTDGYVQLYGYTLYPSEEIITNLQFTNNKEPISAIKTIGDIGRKTTQNTNMTNFYKAIWKDSANMNVNVAELMEQGLDLSAQMARGRGSVNQIDISESGIYIIDANDNDKQMYFGSGILCITQDKWKTSELAIDSGGVIAQTVVGKLILGEKIQVGNEEDTFTITGDGIRVSNSNSANTERIFLGLEQQRNGTKKAVLRLHAASGDNKLVLSEDGIWQCFQIHAGDAFDRTHSYEVPFYIPAKMQRIDEAKLVFKLDYFRAYSKGASSQPQQSGGGTALDGGSVSKTSGADGGFSKSFSTGNTGTSTGAKVTPTNSVHLGIRSVDTATQGRVAVGVSPEHHSHTVVMSGGGWHSHTVNFSVGNHSHSVTIPNHSHSVSLTIPGHSHSILYGIYQHGTLPKVTVYVDGHPIAGLNNTQSINSSAEFNIASYLNKTNGVVTPGVHTIKIVSSGVSGNPDGLGKCSFTILLAGYMSY